jgi:predicted Zn-ribbon and HTH transcriptional regulator
MFRKHLIPVLLDRPMTLSQIAREVHEPPKEIVDALTHLAKSLPHTEYELIVEPAECRRCAFRFRAEKFSRPSKCPQCRSTWIDEPVFSVLRREDSPKKS